MGIVLSVYCGPDCGAAAYKVIAVTQGVVSAAANGGNPLLGAVMGLFTAGAFQYGGIAAGAFAAGVSSVAQGGKFGPAFVSAGLGAKFGGGAGSGPVKVITAALVGGTISKITGGKFANGAGTAAFAAAITTDWSGGSTSGFIDGDEESYILEKKPGLHGEFRELLDGKVRVAKWGSEDSVVSETELGAISSSLGELNSSVESLGGNEMLNLLSKDNPLTILLNDSGSRGALRTKLILTVDINSEVYFNDYNNNNVRTKASLTRILTHESVHAILGRSHVNNFTTRTTDYMLRRSVGTARRFYSNQCTYNWLGFCTR